MGRSLNYREVATLLNVPLGTIYSLVCRKQIPHTRISRKLVRFDSDVIASWLKNHEVETKNVGNADQAGQKPSGNGGQS